jgi:hypothetical protein
MLEPLASVLVLRASLFVPVHENLCIYHTTRIYLHLKVCLFFIYSANSTLQSLDMTDNPISEVGHKAINLEFFLCKMRNPEVTVIHASAALPDEQDAIKIGDGLRYFGFKSKKCCVNLISLFHKKTLLVPPDYFKSNFLFARFTAKTRRYKRCPLRVV